MDSKKSGAKDALKVAQSGTPVPAGDASSSKTKKNAVGGSKKGSMTVAKSLPTESAKSAPVGTAPTDPKKTWEGSSEDWSADYNAAKRRGVSTADYEDSAHDRIADAAGEKRMRDKDGSETVDHPGGYKKGVSAFSNSPKTASGFGHPASARQGHLRCSGHSGAHQIGRKK